MASLDRGALTHRYERMTALPMILVSLAFVAIWLYPVAVPTSKAVDAYLRAASWSLWALFAVDYVVRFCLAPYKLRFVRGNLLDLAVVALAAEQVGGAQRVLDMAVEYAKVRVQFGRPIGSFQAVRHRLAESLVALEAAAALLDAAWEAPSPVTAAMAKAFAGRSARSVARHCQQVMAGIGFTTEHPLHRSIRRAIVLDQLLGAGSVLTRTLGAEILSSAALPAAFPL